MIQTQLSGVSEVSLMLFMDLEIHAVTEILLVFGPYGLRRVRHKTTVRGDLCSFAVT